MPNKLNPNRPTPRHIVNEMTTFKDKERILKATREKQILTYKGAPIRLSSDFQRKHFRPEGNDMKYSRG